MPSPLRSQYAFRRQNLLIEFASLKHASPQGVYISLSPQNPTLWWGVLFVRKGPYASAVLKFTVLFLVTYPLDPPIITFQSDVYHPLVVPPTPPPPKTASSTSSTNTSPGRAQQFQRAPASHYNWDQNISSLPPGSFVLKHGFPTWFSTPSPRTTMTPPSSKKLPPNPPLTSFNPASSSSAAGSASSTYPTGPSREKNIIQVLHYLKSTFSSETVLDGIPTHFAANLGAWRAWRSFRETGKEGARDEGRRVWIDRVDHCVAASQSEGVLFGGMGVGRTGGGMGGEELIRFVDIEDDAYDHMRDMIRTSSRKAEESYVEDEEEEEGEARSVVSSSEASTAQSLSRDY